MTRERARRLVVLAAPIAWMALIFAASSIPGRALPAQPGWDKLAHAVEYGVLGGLAVLALREAGLSARSAATVAILGAIAYGVTDEWHQSFVPNRSVDPADLAADAAGAVAGAGLALLRRRREPPPSRGAPAG